MFAKALALITVLIASAACQPIQISRTRSADSIPVYRIDTFRVHTIVTTTTGGKTSSDVTTEMVHVPSNVIEYYICPTRTLGPNTFNVTRDPTGNITTFGGGGDSGASAALTAAVGAINPLATVTGSDMFSATGIAEAAPAGTTTVTTRVVVYKWDISSSRWVITQTDEWPTATIPPPKPDALERDEPEDS